MILKGGSTAGQPGTALWEVDKKGRLVLCLPNEPDKDDAEQANDVNAARKSPRYHVFLLKRIAVEKEAGSRR